MKAQGWDTGIALPFLQPWHQMGWMVNATPQLLYSWYPLYVWLDGLWSHLDMCRKSRHHRDLNSKLTSPQELTTLTTLPWLPLKLNILCTKVA